MNHPDDPYGPYDLCVRWRSVDIARHGWSASVGLRLSGCGAEGEKRFPMGGCGSGRRSNSKTESVEMYPCLDVNRLRKAGLLSPGSVGGWHWTRDDKHIASIGVHASHDGLRLIYRVRVGEGDWHGGEECAALARAHPGCRANYLAGAVCRRVRFPIKGVGYL